MKELSLRYRSIADETLRIENEERKRRRGAKRSNVSPLAKRKAFQDPFVSSKKKK